MDSFRVSCGEGMVIIEEMSIDWDFSSANTQRIPQTIDDRVSQYFPFKKFPKEFKGTHRCPVPGPGRTGTGPAGTRDRTTLRSCKDS